MRDHVIACDDNCITINIITRTGHCITSLLANKESQLTERKHTELCDHASDVAEGGHGLDVGLPEGGAQIAVLPHVVAHAHVLHLLNDALLHQLLVQRLDRSTQSCKSEIQVKLFVNLFLNYHQILGLTAHQLTWCQVIKNLIIYRFDYCHNSWIKNLIIFGKFFQKFC